MSTMKFLVLGSRLRTYPRNVVVLDALSREHETTEYDTHGKHVLRVVWDMVQYQPMVDGVVLMQPIHTSLWAVFLVRLLWRKRIIGDMFISLYDTFINDRHLASAHSVKAMYYSMLDQLSLLLCDTVFFDTKQHQAYFEQRYHIGRRRMHVLPVSVDIDRMDSVVPTPIPGARPGVFQVFFGGYFIPLQGIEHIIDAAHILRNHTEIQLTLLGGGQTYREMVSRASTLGLTNIQFLPPVPYDTYLAYLKSADLALGVFGSSDKAQRVVSNKIIEAAALGTPLLTGRSEAVSSYFADADNIFFADMADPTSLAQSLLRAVSHPTRAQIGAKGRQVVEQYFSATHVRKVVREW